MIRRDNKSGLCGPCVKKSDSFRRAASGAAHRRYEDPAQRTPIRAIRLAIEAVDPRLEQAASTLGAGPAMVFLTVTLPLMLPGVVAGAILAFAKALGEFGATITFVSNIPGQTQTLPSAIYAFLQVPGQESAAARLVIVSLAIAMAALILSEYLARRVARRVAGA